LLSWALADRVLLVTMWRVRAVPLVLATLVVVAAPAWADHGASHQGSPACPVGAGSGADEQRSYIVQFAPDADVRAEVAAVRSMTRLEWQFTSVLSGVTARLDQAHVACLERRPGVLMVEPDGEVNAYPRGPVTPVSGTDGGTDASTTPVTQVDPPWGLDRIDQRSLPLSGAFTAPLSGSGITAYIVDTGIRSDHVDLQGRVGAGFTAIDDGGGTADCNGHGTHVAGTVGGQIHGVAKAVHLEPVRVLGCNGSGTFAGVIAGLDWIAAKGQAPAVVNMSLGGSANASLDAAVVNLVSMGFVVVAAAGNASSDACNYSPARVAQALTVGSSDITDSMSSFSNSGPCVDMFAPGSAVVSAWNTSPTANATLSGTSMAAPHVAGVAALALAQDPTMAADQAVDAITSDASAGVLSGVQQDTNNALVFLRSSPSGEITVPDAPSSLTAVASRKSVDLAWVAAFDGGSPLTEQHITIRWKSSTTVVVVSGSDTSAKVTGLNKMGTYTFTVRAVNSAGVGPESQAVSVDLTR
jgi:subtilisin family serine protease